MAKFLFMMKVNKTGNKFRPIKYRWGPKQHPAKLWLFQSLSTVFFNVFCWPWIGSHQHPAQHGIVCLLECLPSAVSCYHRRNLKTITGEITHPHFFLLTELVGVGLGNLIWSISVGNFLGSIIYTLCPPFFFLLLILIWNILIGNCLSPLSTQPQFEPHKLIHVLIDSPKLFGCRKLTYVVVHLAS